MLTPSKRVALVGIMAAVLEAAKFSLSFLANVELVTLLLIIFTLTFGKETYWAAGVFILLEGILYGFGLWWIMYLYTWPLLILLTRLFKKQKSPFFWAILSAVFGYFYGLFCTIPYLVTGGLMAGIAWWTAGIPFDLIHGTANFLIALLLYKPLIKAMTAVTVRYCQ